MAANPQPIRDLISQGRFIEAEKALSSFSGGEKELLQALVFLYTGREEQAVPFAGLDDDLRRQLGAHFACRAALNPSDTKAAALAKKLGGLSGGVKVSACLITKNEADNLPRCLDSLSGFADEIVVVDTGSTDGTLKIAQDAGAVTGFFEWQNDFAAARNEAIRLATGNWILWIDADEELTPSSIAVLREAIIRPQFGGFNAELVNYTDDASDEAVYVHHALRLFQNLPGVAFEGRIHEQVTPSLERLSMPWANLPGFQILHHGYRPSVMKARGKVERTIAMLQREVREHPQDPFHWFNLANALTVAQRWSEAVHAARTCSRHLEPASEYGALAYQFLINALAQEGKYSEAIQACDEADAKGFGGLFVDFERANVLLKKGRMDDALFAADRCCEAEWLANTTGDRSIYDTKRYVLRGQILAVLGRFDEALAEFDKVPAGPASLYSKAATLEKANRVEDALELFLQLRDTPETAQLALNGCGRVCMKLGLPQKSAEFFEQAWRMNPEDYDAWAGWAQACETWGDVGSIVAAYEAFAQKHEPTPEILVNWGRALELAGTFDQALDCYTEAIKRDPNNGNAYFNCGDLLYKMGQYQDAAHLYQAGLRLSPLNAQGWFVLGNSLAQMGLVQGAKIGYEQALVLDPNYNEAKHNLEIILEAA